MKKIMIGICIFTVFLLNIEITAGGFASIGRSIARKKQEYQKYKQKDEINKDRWDQDLTEKKYDSPEDIAARDALSIPEASMSDEIRMQLLQGEISQILRMAKDKLYKNPQEAFLILYNAADGNEKRFKQLAELNCDCGLLEDEYGSLSVRVSEKFWAELKEQKQLEDQATMKDKLKNFLVHLDVLLWHEFKFYNDQAAKDRLQAIEEQVYGTALRLDEPAQLSYPQNYFSEFTTE